MLHKTTSLIAALAMAPSLAFAQGSITPPPVPSDLEPPAGSMPFLIVHATGTQNYICMPSGKRAAWMFLGPQATLFDDASEQVLTHFLSPNPVENGTARATWQHSRDSSTVWAAAIASSVDPAYVSEGAIPWLLLEAVGVQYGPTMGDRLTQTAFIQRVNTAGGTAPAAGCKVATDIGTRALVPYTTDYIFYR